MFANLSFPIEEGRVYGICPLSDNQQTSNHQEGNSATQRSSHITIIFNGF